MWDYGHVCPSAIFTCKNNHCKGILGNLILPRIYHDIAVSKSANGKDPVCITSSFGWTSFMLINGWRSDLNFPCIYYKRLDPFFSVLPLAIWLSPSLIRTCGTLVLLICLWTIRIPFLICSLLFSNTDRDGSIFLFCSLCHLYGRSVRLSCSDVDAYRRCFP